MWAAFLFFISFISKTLLFATTLISHRRIRSGVGAVANWAIPYLSANSIRNWPWANRQSDELLRRVFFFLAGAPLLTLSLLSNERVTFSALFWFSFFMGAFVLMLKVCSFFLG